MQQSAKDTAADQSWHEQLHRCDEMSSPMLHVEEFGREVSVWCKAFVAADLRRCNDNMC